MTSNSVNKMLRISPSVGLTVALCAAIFNCNSQSVDPLTGRAVVNVPIGSISARDITISANLVHHGGSLKLNEAPGNAGMGWQVFVGGSVSREVRGLPDDFSRANDSRTGWLVNNNANAIAIQGFSSSSDDNVDDCTDEVSDWNFIENLNYVKDSEPDIFYFSAPGLSGKFVFGSDGLPKLVPFQDVVISYTTASNATSINSFTIKTNTGFVYTFSSISNLTRQAYGTANTTKSLLYQQPATYAIAWNLTSIESKATGTIANFTYLDSPRIFSAIFSGTNDPTHVNVAVDTLNKLKEAVAPKRLSQVTVASYVLNIAWTNDLVDKVTVSESESGASLEYDLIYKSVTSTGDTDFPKIAKPFLSEVKQQDPVNCEALPSHQFEYQLVDLINGQADIPWRSGLGEDFFGYFNGVGSVNVPTLYFYSNETNARRYRVHPIPGGNPQVLNAPNNGSMAVNGAFAVFGALKKITFPTGGSCSYQYELNKYFDATTNEEFSGPGVRVASVSTFGGEMAYGKLAANSGYHATTITYEYTNLGSAQTSGRITFPPAFGFTRGTTVHRTQSDWTEGTQLYYGRVKESVAGQGYREYIFDLPNMYPDADATKSKVARAAGSTCTGTLYKNGAYGFPFAPLKDFGYTRGLPLSVTEYDAANNKTRERIVTYTSNTGSVVKGLRYEWLANSVYNFSLYEIPVNASKLTATETIKDYSEEAPSTFTSSTSVYIYNSRNLLTQSTSTAADGSVFKNFVRYASDFSNIVSPAANDQQANAIFKLNTTNRTSAVVETYQTYLPAGGTEMVTGARLNLFKDYGGYVPLVQTLSFAQESIALPSPGTLSTSTATNFTPHASFKLKGPISDWANGLPVSQTDPYTLVSAATHYATGPLFGLASFANAKSEQAVYEGFEFASANGLQYSGTGVALLNNGRAGKKSLQVGSSNATVASVATITKKENSYRISAWILAGTNATLTVQAKNGATVQGTTALNYTTPGQWKYVETFMDMSSVSSLFSLTLQANATLQLDDFVAIPKSARVSYSSIVPLKGLTDKVDDRGNSAKAEIDNFGRATKSYDRGGNLRELKEYTTQRSSRVELNPGFSSSVLQYVIGQNSNFTAVQQASCLSPITYSWTVRDPNNNATSYSGSSISHMFRTYGVHAITLSVSSGVAGYQPVSFTENICVTMPETLALNLTVNEPTTIYKCSPTDGAYRTFNAVFSNIDPAITTSMAYRYDWYVRALNGNWIFLTSTSTGSPMYDPYNPSQPLPPNQVMYANPQNSYHITCVASWQTTLPHAPVANSTCNDQRGSISAGGYIFITYVDNSPCP